MQSQKWIGRKQNLDFQLREASVITTWEKLEIACKTKLVSL